MPQALLPMIPPGATPISDLISVVRQDEQWTYFCGVQPIFEHAGNDRPSFRMFTAQLCCQGTCTQAQIMRTFGVSRTASCAASPSIAKGLTASTDLAEAVALRS